RTGLLQCTPDGPGRQRPVASGPGGAAVNVATQYGMLRNWGFEGRPVALAVSLTTLWSQFATFVFPVVAIALLSLDGGHDMTLRTVALAGLVIAAILVGALVAVL